MSKISEMAKERRHRFSQDLAKWIGQLADQQRNEFQAICRTEAGRKLIAERRALDAEYVRDIEPIVAPEHWRNLQGAELADADLIQRDYYFRCDVWQERWNKLSESVLTNASNDASPTTFDGFLMIDLKRMAGGVDNKTVNRFAAKTTVKKTPKGMRNRRYAVSETQLILESLIAHCPTRHIVNACTTSLAEIGNKSE
jgi:hypothetical protein